MIFSTKKKFVDCEKYQWDSIFSNNVTFFVHPLKTTGTIIPKINRIFLRNYDSKNLTEYTGNFTNIKTAISYLDNYPSQDNCLCSNLLEEVI